MHSNLRQLQRRMNLTKPAPEPPPAVDTAGLGVALQQLIDSAVHQQVADAVEKQKPLHNPAIPPHRQPFTDKAEQHEFPAPPASTKPPKDFTMLIQRDELGRIKTFTVGNHAKFELQRNGEGKTTRVVQLD